jgi:hypothetical protein
MRRLLCEIKVSCSSLTTVVFFFDIMCLMQIKKVEVDEN